MSNDTHRLSTINSERCSLRTPRGIVLLDNPHLPRPQDQYESTAVNNIGSYIHYSDKGGLPNMLLSDKIYA